MSVTHGKKVHFQWEFLNDQVKIVNQEGRIHEYHLQEILRILTWLDKEFGLGWFPLANNVVKLNKGTEKSGLGMAILEQVPGDITHAQGASFLGVVLDSVGIFSWNGAKKGIQWRITNNVKDIQSLRRIMESASH